MLARKVVVAAFLVTGLLLVMPALSMAATVYWDPAVSGGTALGGTGNWDTTDNFWWNSTADNPWNNGNYDTAVFQGTGGAVSVTQPIQAGGLTFNSAGYTIGGGTITLGGLTTPTISGNSNATINSVLSGSSGMTYNGSALLTLGGNNVYTGATTISSGTLQANSPSALAGNVSVSSGAQLNLVSAGSTYNNTITGSGYLKILFNHVGGSTDDYINGVTGFSGTMELALNGGNGTGDKWDCVSAPNLTVIIDSGTQLFGGGTFESVYLSGTGNSENRGAIRLSGTVTAPLTLLGNTTIGAEGGTIAGSITSGLSGTQTLTLGGPSDSSGNITITGAIGGGTGTIGITQVTSALVTLSGTSSTYTGPTLISAGTMQVNGSLQGTNITDNATLNFANATAQTFSGTISGNGTLWNTAAGSMTLNAANTFTGATNLGAGTLALGNGLALQNSTLNMAGGALSFGTLTSGTLGGLQGANNLALQNASSAAVALTVGNNNATTTFGGALTGSGSLLWVGTGGLTLTNANSYSGATTISAGTLQLGTGQSGQDGSLTGTTGVTNNAALVYNLYGNQTAGYPIGGTGSLTKLGASTLTLGLANTYGGTTLLSAGTLALANGQALQNSTVSLGGGALSFGGLASATFGGIMNTGNLSLTNTAAVGVALTVGGNGATTTYSGLLSGSGSLLKTGAGMLTLAAANQQTGGLTVSGGTVTLNTAQTYGGTTTIAAGATLYVSSAPASPVPGTLLYDLDASNSANLTTSSGSVTAWTDSSPNHYAFTLSSASAPMYVTSGSNTINGHPAVVFNGAASNQLVLNTALSTSTIFYVTQTTNYGSMLNTLWGPNSGDGGMRMASATSWQTPVSGGDGNDFVNGAGAAVFINGVATTTFTANTPYVFDAYRGAGYGRNNQGTTIGGVYPGRFYYGNVGEVMAYSSSLSTADRQADEAYLQAKWMNVGIVGGTNILPANSPVVLGGSGATLSLGYASQTFSSINGSAGSSILLGTDGNVSSGTLTTGTDNSSATFAGNISGYGTLVKAGTGTFVLSGSNTGFLGGTTVSSGALQLGDGANPTAFMPGNVLNNAGLTFANPNNATYAGVIGGSGSVTVTGPGLLTYSSPAHSYSGSTTLSGGTLSVTTLPVAGTGGTAGPLGASSNVAANLVFQGGTLLYTGTTATTDRNFTINGNSNATFNVASSTANLTLTGGAAAGSLGNLVKTGPGTLTLAASNAQTGGLTVGGGTVTVSTAQGYTGSTVIAAGATLYVPTAPAPVTTNLLYQLDASAGTGLTVSNGTVSAMNDVSGHGNNFTSTGNVTVLSGTAGINGRSVVHFGGSGQLLLNNSTAPQTILIVDRVTAYTGLGGIWGQVGDNGIREASSSSWYYQNGSNSNDFAQAGNMYINGVQVASGANGAFTVGTTQLLEATNPNSVAFAQTGLGEYGTGGAAGRYYNGDIGEVLAYSGVLTTAQRQTDEEYLEAKWLGTGNYLFGVSNLLPTTPLVLSGSGATLNLGYASQAFSSINGAAGSSILLAQGSASAGTLTTGSDSTNATFAGNISGYGTLLKTGTGTFVLSGSNTGFLGTTTVGSGVLQLGDGVSPTALAQGNILNSAALTFANPNAVTYGGSIGGSGSVAMVGPGLLALTATNSYSGGTTISGGTLQLNAGGAVATLAGSSNVTVNAGGTLLANATDALGNSSAGAANLTVTSSGIVSVTAGNRVTLYNAVNMTGGTLTSAAGTGNNGNYSLYGQLNATSDGSGNAATINATQLGLQASPTVFSVTHGSGAIDLVVSSAVASYTGGAGLTKQGNGVMLLSGNNTYSGATTVSGGVLDITGTMGAGGYSMTGGTINFSGQQTITGAQIMLGATNGTTGTLNITGGNLVNNAANGTILGQIGGTGVMNVSGGTYTDNPAAGQNWLIGNSIGSAGSSGALNISSGGLVVAANPSAFIYLAREYAASGTINLNGGTLSTGRSITQDTSDHSTGTATVNFNGGTLQAQDANNPAWIAGITSANILDGGATFNTNGFNMGIPQALLAGGTGIGTVTKTGAGTLTLGGSNTYPGATNVNAGVLAVNGSLLSGGTVNVAAGATLSGTGSVGNANVAAGGLIDVTANGTNPLTFNSLNFSGGSININGSTPPSTPLINVTSANGLSAGGVTTINITGLAAVTGTYDLVGFSGNIGGSGSSAFVLGSVPPTSSRQVPTLIDTGSMLVWQVVGGNPVWTGSNGSAFSGGTNWVVPGAGPTDYLAGDIMTVNDIASGNTTLAISTSNVYPTSITFNNNATPYTLSGAFGISGSGSLVKNGSGSLTITASNSYTGVTQLNAGLLDLNGPSAIGMGTLVVNGGTLGNTSGTLVTLSTANPQNWNADVVFVGPNDLNLGTGAVTLGSSRTVTVTAGNLTVGGAIGGAGFSLTKAGAGNLVLGGANTYNAGTFVLAGTLTTTNDAALSNGPVTLSPSSGTAVLALTSASPSIGLLANSGAGTSLVVLGNAAAGSPTALTLGANNSNITFGSVIADQSGANSAATGSLVKLGTGTLTLSASNTYTGGTTLTNGTIVDNNAAGLGTGTLVMNGGTLQTTLAGNNNIGSPTPMNTIQINPVAGNAFNTPGGNNMVLGGNLVGSGTVTKTGAYSLWLTGSNSGFGGTFVNAQSNLFLYGSNTGSPNASWVISGGEVWNDLPGTQTISFGALSGSAPLSNSVTGTATFSIGALGVNSTFSGVIANGTGAVAIAKTGIGGLTLTGANTYTGGTTVSAGTLEGQWNAGGTWGTFGTGPIVNNATLLFTRTGGGDPSFNQAITGSGATILQSTVGGAYLNLNSAASFSAAGDLTVLNTGLNIGLVSQTIGALNGGTSAIITSNLSAGNVTLSVGNDNNSGTFSGIITSSAGALQLVKAGSGTELLSGTNSYTGGTQINGGAIQLGNNSALGSNTAAVTVAGGLLDLNGFSPTIGAINGAGTIDNVTAGGSPVLTIGNGGASGNFSGTIQNTSGTLALLKTGAGTQVLSGTNTYNGGTLVNGGVLNFTAGAVPLANNSISFGGGTLQWAAGNSQDVSAAIAPIASGQNASLDTNGNSVAFASSLSGSGGLIKAGAGTLSLTVSNSFTGQTTVTAGTLNVAHAQALASSTVSVSNNNGLAFSVPAATLGGLAGAGNVNLGATSLTVGANNASTVYSGALSGGAGLTKTGSGVLSLSVANNYSGATNISGGVLRLNAVPGSPVSGSLIYDLDPSNAANFTLSGGYVTQLNDLSGNGNNFTNANSTVTVVNGGSAFNGNNVLNFNGTSTATLTLNNTTNPATVFIIEQVNGLTAAQPNNMWGVTGKDTDIRVNPGPIIQNAGGSGTNNNDFTYGTGSTYVNGVLQTGNVTAGAAQLLEAYAGSGLAVATPWSSTSLSNGAFMNRYYDGYIGEVVAYSSSLSAAARQADEAYLMYKWFGVVEPGYAANNVLPAATPVTISNGSTLDMTNGTQTIASLSSTDGLGSQVLLGNGLLTVAGSATTTFDGTISGNGGSLVQQGSGMLVFTGSNTYSGGTTISSGTLQLGDGSAKNGFVQGSVADNSVLAFANPLAQNFSGQITGSGSVTKSGAGMLTLAASNGYSGGTYVSGGTLQLGNAAALGTGGLTANAGVVDLNHFPLSGGNALLSLSGSAGTITDNSSFGTPTLAISQTGNTTFGGSILTGSNPLGITLYKDGAGSLTLSGTSTTAGGTKIYGGTLAITGSLTTKGASANNSSTLLVNGGMISTSDLSVNGGAQLTGTGTINLAGGAGLYVQSTTPFTFPGILTGPQGVEIDTPSQVTLAGGNNYSGATLIDAGGLLIAGAANTLSPSSAVTVSGTLDVTAAPQTVGSFTMAGGALNLYVGNLLTSTGSASLGGTLNLFNLGSLTSGTTEILAYGGYTGNFSSYTPLPSGYNLVYTPSQLDIISSGAAFSGSGTWLGTTASWNNSVNWTDGANHGVPGDGTRPAGMDSATFSGSGTVTTITLDTNPNLAAISFSNSSYTLSGGSLTLQSSTGTATVTALSGTQTFDATVTLNLATSASFAVSNSAQITLAAVASGSGALSLTGDGTGTLVLSGTNNTYGGGTYVDTGTLIANNSGAIPDGSSLTVGAGGVFIFDPTVTGTPSAVGSGDARPAGVEAVPEPGTLALLSAGLIAAIAVWRKRRAGGRS